MIRYHAQWLLPVAQPPIANGWVDIADGRIVAIGGDAPHDTAAGTRSVDLGSVAILPGLVNAHTHLELSYLRALHDGYAEFVESISKVIPVIRVDYERFATAEEMAEVIRREYMDVSFLRQVTRFDPAR